MPEIKGKFSKYYRNFVKLCLDRDDSKRPTAEQLLEHKFLKNAVTHKAEFCETMAKYKEEMFE